MLGNHVNANVLEPTPESSPKPVMLFKLFAVPKVGPNNPRLITDFISLICVTFLFSKCAKLNYEYL